MEYRFWRSLLVAYLAVRALQATADKVRNLATSDNYVTDLHISKQLNILAVGIHLIMRTDTCFIEGWKLSFKVCIAPGFLQARTAAENPFGKICPLAAEHPSELKELLCDEREKLFVLDSQSPRL